MKTSSPDVLRRLVFTHYQGMKADPAFTGNALAHCAGAVLSIPELFPGTGTVLMASGVPEDGASVVVTMVLAASAGMVLSIPDVLPGTGLLVWLVLLVTRGASVPVTTVLAASAGTVESMPELLPGTGTELEFSGVATEDAVCAKAMPLDRAKTETAAIIERFMMLLLDPVGVENDAAR